MSDLDAFLAGDRPDDVAFFLHEDVVSAPEALDEYATAVGDGIVVVIDGTRGREAFQSAVGVDPMALASKARDRDGRVEPDLAGGECPDGDGNHAPQFVFAFAEAQNEEVGDIYAEGDVMHAYVSCSCGVHYSDRWIIGERE